MTTTAFYRQLTEEPQPMDALRTQTERAEAAEAELLAVRDDNHSMMLEIHNLRIERDALVAELAKLRELHSPVPAVAAPAVSEEWCEVMTELADDLAIEIDQSYPPERRAYPSEQRRYEGEMAIVNRARALLQSEVRHD